MRLRSGLIVRMVAITLGSSLVIGNVVSWLNGAWPIDFAPLPYSQQEQRQLKELDGLAANADTRADALQARALTLFLHNDLDGAQRELSKVVDLGGGNQAYNQCLHHAIDAKVAGARLDLLMGLRKLAQFKRALKGLEACGASQGDLPSEVLALSVFAGAAAFQDNAHLAEQIAGRIAPRLDRALGSRQPTELVASGYLAITKAHLYMARAQAAEPWTAHALQSWRKYQQCRTQLGASPPWQQPLEDELWTALGKPPRS